jgi:hypothetical protein
VQTLPRAMDKLDQEQLEAWEGFTARFARVADSFLSKYLRTFVGEHEPGFRGSMRDYLNQAEKLGLIESAQLWAEIRECVT